jgi:hypothetical protein
MTLLFSPYFFISALLPFPLLSLFHHSTFLPLFLYFSTPPFSPSFFISALFPSPLLPLFQHPTFSPSFFILALYTFLPFFLCFNTHPFFLHILTYFNRHTLSTSVANETFASWTQRKSLTERTNPDFLR